MELYCSVGSSSGVEVVWDGISGSDSIIKKTWASGFIRCICY